MRQMSPESELPVDATLYERRVFCCAMRANDDAQSATGTAGADAGG